MLKFADRDGIMTMITTTVIVRIIHGTMIAVIGIAKFLMKFS